MQPFCSEEGQVSRQLDWRIDTNERPCLGQPVPRGWLELLEAVKLKLIDEHTTLRVIRVDLFPARVSSEVIRPRSTVLIRTSRNGVNWGNLSSPCTIFLHTRSCLTCHPCKREGQPL